MSSVAICICSMILDECIAMGLNLYVVSIYYRMLEYNMPSNNPWILHMAATRKLNPNAEFKEIAKIAKKTYKAASGVVSKTVSKKSRKAKKGTAKKSRKAKKGTAKKGKKGKKTKKGKK